MTNAVRTGSNEKSPQHALRAFLDDIQFNHVSQSLGQTAAAAGEDADRPDGQHTECRGFRDGAEAQAGQEVSAGVEIGCRVIACGR